MDKAWTIAKQSLEKNMKSFNYWFMVIFPLIIFAVIFVIAYVSSQSEPSQTIALVGGDDQLAEQVRSADSVELDSSIQSQEQASQALAAEEIDGYLLIQGPADDIQAEFIHTMGLQDSAIQVQALSALLSQIQMQNRAVETGMQAEKLAQLMEKVEVKESRKIVEDGQVREEDGSNLIVSAVISYILSFIIYMVIIFYPSIIINDLATEKGTRVMEVILSSTTSSIHFLGKMLAVFIMLVVHFFIYAIFGLLAFQLIKGTDIAQSILAMISLDELFAALNIYLFIFVLLGIMTYVIISAFLGSASSSVEDAQKAVSPIALTGMLGLFASMFGLTQPQSQLIVTSSYIPLLSPFSMPVRILTETVSVGGIWLAIVINLMFMAAVLAITLLFYRANLLVYSDDGVWKGFKRSFNILRSERQAKN